MQCMQKEIVVVALCMQRKRGRGMHAWLLMLPDLVARAAHDLLSRNPAPDRKHCPREKGRNS